MDLTRALVAAGYRAVVASAGGRLADEVRAAGGIFVCLPVDSKNPLTIWLNITRLARIIRKYHVAVIHARSRAPAWSSYYAARRTGIAFVTTYHGAYHAKTRLKHRYNAIMARADMVIANSFWTARHIRATYGFTPSLPTVIPRGLDLAEFDPKKVSPDRVAAVRARWNVVPGDRVVLLPGRLTRWKGQRLLVQAVARLSRAGRLPAEVRVVLAGDAQGRKGYVDELTGAIRAAGLLDVFRLTGHVADMPAAYLASEIVVCPSTEPEAFGRIPIEAGAMERPVIAADHGATGETVSPGETGLVVRPRDIKALSEALETLLTAPEAQRTAMGKNGRVRALEHFTLERMCADTINVYERLLRARGAWPATG